MARFLLLPRFFSTYFKVPILLLLWTVGRNNISIYITIKPIPKTHADTHASIISMLFY
jgi:hypothetical protein